MSQQPSDAQTFDTFVFDLDGTLLNTLPDLVALTNLVLEKCGYPRRSTEEVLSYVGNGARALMFQAVPDATSQEDAEKALAMWRDIYFEFPNDLTKPYPEIPETVDELKRRGCKVAVLSNKFDGGVRQIMDQCMPGVFELRWGESDTIARKPDPTGLLKIIATLGSTPERSIYVGDSPSDILTARRAHVFSVGVSWGYHEVGDFKTADLEPDLLIDDPRELLSLAK